MKIRIIGAGTALILAFAAMAAVQANEPPSFMQKTLPGPAVEGAWQEFQAVMLDPDAALEIRSRELIALGIAAQVPCEYCVYYHTRAARNAGASDAEIRQALAVAASVRKWSTMLNGSLYDPETWRAEVDALFDE